MSAMSDHLSFGKPRLTSGFVSKKTLAVVIYMWFLMFLERINIRELDHTIVPAYTVNELRRPMLFSQI